MIQKIGIVPGDPTAPVFHRFRSESAEHLLIVPFSRVFDLSSELARGFDAGDPSVLALAHALAAPTRDEVPLEDVVVPSPQSISLNVSVACNLACSYCYASGGAFNGAQPSAMSWSTAQRAIDQLLSGADHARPVTIAFMGGEPFVNRSLIHRAVAYADAAAKSREIDVRFSDTTNGTLLGPDDIALLRAHRFAVTVSVDGGATLHDAQRPLHGRAAGGSFAALRRAFEPLLRDPGLAQIVARATVTRRDLNVASRVAAILKIGFQEVGVSPLRVDPRGGQALVGADWGRYLDALKAAARVELTYAERHHRLRLTNLAVALRQIHRGASAPYPCGAGGGYFSVASDGRWFACHRAIGSADFDLGDGEGLDAEKRRRFLKSRHVHAQSACRRCWARYLCSGACHQEASARSDSGCGFIRGWLEFCLATYCDVLNGCPELLHAVPDADEGAVR
ncbi:MAG: radical SAM protein [Acidobacteria bacterium]|nr:MAG: radical SAM protein [Acidobacteriota bacterium]